MSFTKKIKCSASVFGLVLSVILILPSCASRQNMGMERTAHAVHISDVAISHKTLVADLKIDKERVSRSERWIFGRKGSNALELRKQLLMTQLLDQYGADVLVGTKVDVRRRWSGATQLTLSGFPAKYDEVRTANDADLSALEKGKSLEQLQIMAMTDSISPAAALIDGEHSLPIRTWRVLVGGSIAKSNGAYEANGSGHLALDYRLRLAGRWYYGAMLGLEMGALSSATSPFYIGVDIVPIRFGRDFYVNNQNSFFLHAGAAMKWIPLVKPTECSAQWGASYLSESKGIGVGLELAAGWQWNRFSLQFAPRLYFRPYVGSDKLITDFAISFGVKL